MEGKLQVLGMKCRLASEGVSKGTGQQRVHEGVCKGTGQQRVREGVCKGTGQQSVGALPFRCPRCGESTRFRSLASLRAHLQVNHTFPPPPTYRAPPLTTHPSPRDSSPTPSELNPAPSSSSTAAEANPPPPADTRGGMSVEAELQVRLWVALMRAEHGVQLQSAHAQWRHLVDEQQSLSRQIHTAAGVIASLRQQLSTSQQQLEQRESEVSGMQSWLVLASEHEQHSKERLRSFMETLLQRLSLAERDLEPQHTHTHASHTQTHTHTEHLVPHPGREGHKATTRKHLTTTTPHTSDTLISFH